MADKVLTGYADALGHLVNVTATTPLPVTGGASTGTNGSAIPGSSTLIGWDDGSGNLQPVSAANPLPISGTINATSAAQATTAPPSYTNNTSNPFSQNLTGDLRTITKQNGSWTVGLDQTTPGSTNAVDVTNFPVTVDTNAGNAGASTIRVVVATNQAAIPASQNGTWNVATVTTITGVTTAFGATGSAVPANAVYNGLIAKTANPTAASDGSLVGGMADKLGRQVVVIGNVRDNKANTYTALSSATEATVIAAVASTFLDVYGVIASNTTASAVTLTFKDSTGGTTQFLLYVPANDTRGLTLPSSDGFKQTTVNTAWTCTGGASGVNISMLYVKNI